MRSGGGWLLLQGERSRTQCGRQTPVCECLPLSAALAPEAQEQLAFADIILVNKVDLVDACGLATVERRIETSTHKSCLVVRRRACHDRVKGGTKEPILQKAMAIRRLKADTRRVLFAGGEARKVERKRENDFTNSA